MKNLSILLIICCVNIFAQPQHYFYTKKNKGVALQLQKLQAQLQKLQVQNAILAKKNQQLHSALTKVQHEKVQMQYQNDKLQKQVVHLQIKMQRFLPQTKKYDTLYKEHEKLKTNYKTVWDKAQLYETKHSLQAQKFHKLAKSQKNILTENEKLKWQNAKLAKKNTRLQKKVVVLEKNCKEHALKHDKHYKAYPHSKKLGLVKPQANYAIKFVGKKMQRAHIENEMFKLANEASFSVVSTEKESYGVAVKIHYAENNIQHLARIIVRKFAKQGIYAGVAKIAAKEITMRISPWSVYSS